MADIRANVQPIGVDASLTDKTYEALKASIASMNIYAMDEDPRIDERQLSEDLGVSRTPIREAIARLEQERLVRIVARKGVFIVRKTKKEIIEMITVWAAMESMAARLIALHASDEEIKSLRKMFATFEDGRGKAQIDEYSETNIRFHQALLRMSKCELLIEMTENLFIHMRSIRMRTISEDNRADRSIIDHINIIEALENRDVDLAEKLARQHTLDLADHVDRTALYLK